MFSHLQNINSRFLGIPLHKPPKSYRSFIMGDTADKLQTHGMSLVFSQLHNHLEAKRKDNYRGKTPLALLILCEDWKKKKDFSEMDIFSGAKIQTQLWPHFKAEHCRLEWFIRFKVNLRIIKYKEGKHKSFSPLGFISLRLVWGPSRESITCHACKG